MGGFMGEGGAILVMSFILARDFSVVPPSK